MKKYKILGSKNLPASEVEIECEIDAESVSIHRAKALAKIQKEVNMPGFRPGHVPETILIKQVGDLFIYNEMADLAINDAFPEIVAEAKANFIAMPHIQITKIADKNPIQFKIVGPIMPEIKLPDYKKIAKKINAENASVNTEVTEKEMTDTTEEIRKSVALREHKHEAKEGETCDHNNLPLPEVTDEWVKKFGFATVEDFQAKIKDGIKKEKEFKARDKNRMAIIEKIAEDTKVTLPKILIDSELSKMQAQFEDDIVRAGLKVDEYLKHLKKTKEDLAKEWTPDAEKRAKVQLLVSKMALAEKIEADPEQVKKEVENLLKIYKEAKEDRTRAYVEMMLTNEKVFEFLETIK